ncbi:hypothetical protein J2S74_002877 [Evansella vedderi]|uniref:Uncharacterized protein n=1 Tax=Evansella vedderi TaxID=38282 RepID=A0ABT9ZW84_9BACI|nr:hypothetical protein [Evansella vedderi]MDQ0255495.1 hypothetical protein [Evansella vedderi]
MLGYQEHTFKDENKELVVTSKKLAEKEIKQDMDNIKNMDSDLPDYREIWEYNYYKVHLTVKGKLIVHTPHGGNWFFVVTVK